MAVPTGKDENNIIEEIWHLLEPIVAAEGKGILEIEYRRESAGWVLRIYIDSEEGISVEDCAEISRVAGDVLDVADIIQNPYNLEVSSPGLDRPLRKLEHFLEHLGDVIEIRTHSPIQGRRNFKGLLKEALADSVSIECDDKGYSIPRPLIERARFLYFDSMDRRSR